MIRLFESRLVTVSSRRYPAVMRAVTWLTRLSDGAFGRPDPPQGAKPIRQELESTRSDSGVGPAACSRVCGSRGPQQQELSTHLRRTCTRAAPPSSRQRKSVTPLLHRVPKSAQQGKKPPKPTGKACRTDSHNEQDSRVDAFKNLAKRAGQVLSLLTHDPSGNPHWECAKREIYCGWNRCRSRLLRFVQTEYGLVGK
jgi:hypothetical protein